MGTRFSSKLQVYFTKYIAIVFSKRFHSFHKIVSKLFIERSESIYSPPKTYLNNIADLV